MKVFISGGCKNGKSTHAQNLAHRFSQGGKLYYVATMQPKDEEDRARIRRHIQERDGMGFETIEQPVNIHEILNICDPDGTIMLDAVTALLQNEMFRDDGVFDMDCAPRVSEDLKKLCAGIKNAVFVSDYIYSDAAVYDEFTEKYRAGLALLDKTLAQICEVVIEVANGNMTVHKGGELL